MKLNHNVRPDIIKQMDLEYDKPQEYCFTMYMPIKMVGIPEFRLPIQFEPYEYICHEAWYQEQTIRKRDMRDIYMYLTVKYLFVTHDNPANRPGWHSDGFLTDDINYVWFDKYPTVFCVQDFDVDADHFKSLAQFEAQARDENFWVAPEKTLLRLDARHVHKVPLDIPEGGDFRTFVKVTFSKERYNLKGNAKNPLFEYDWTMHDRSVIRNHTNADYVEYSHSK
jgi:hypothetical protein